MRRRRKAREEEEGGFHGNRLVSRETRGGDVSAEAGMLGEGTDGHGVPASCCHSREEGPHFGGRGGGAAGCVHQHGGL